MYEFEIYHKVTKEVSFMYGYSESDARRRSPWADKNWIVCGMFYTD